MQHYLGTIDQGVAFLPMEEQHHLLKVKRVNLHETIEVGDGKDVYLCDVESLDPLLIAVKEKLSAERELNRDVTIAFGLLKGDHNDWTILKGTELGINRFLPFLSERTIVKPQGKEDPRLLRFRKIAAEGAKQCRRARVPLVEEYGALSAVFNEPAELKLFAYEDMALHGTSLHQALTKSQPGERILLVVGPEGGFSEKEAKEAVSHGFLPVSLGQRILRAETAALFGAAVISSFCEGE